MKIKKKELSPYDEKQISIVDFLVIIGFVTLIFILPWEDFQGEKFIDKLNYFNYFTYFENVLTYTELTGVLDFISSEALWHWLIPYLYEDLGIKLDLIFNGITLFTLTTFSFFFLRQQKWYSLILLVNPLFITFAFSQLRMALAYSIVLLVYMFRRKKWTWIFLLSAVLIHSSIPIFLLVYLATIYAKKLYDKRRISKPLLILICVMVGFSISVVIGPLRSILLGAIGDRRAGYGDASSSLLYSLFWMGLFVASLIQRKQFYQIYNNLYSLVILSLVTMNLLTGGYTLRFLSVGLPMIISSMLYMDRDKRMVCLGVYSFYVALQWLYWLGMKPL